MAEADLALGVAWKAASLFALVVSLVLAVLIGRLKADFAGAASHGKAVDRIDALETRMTVAEGRIAATPDQAAVAAITRLLEELKGELKALRAEHAGVRQAEERTEERLGRIEDYLLKAKN